MLENIFEYSLLSFLLSIVLILLVLVKTNIKMWQLWLLAVGLTYPGAVIANHFGAQFLLLILFAVGVLLVPAIRQLLFTKPLYKVMRKSSVSRISQKPDPNCIFFAEVLTEFAGVVWNPR